MGKKLHAACGRPLTPRHPVGFISAALLKRGGERRTLPSCRPPRCVCRDVTDKNKHLSRDYVRLRLELVLGLQTTPAPFASADGI